MKCVDEAVNQFLDKWDLPGAAVAVVKDGRLVYSRGFGLADVEKKEAVRPDDLFRIASISKPITSAVVMKLVEQGKLRLDEPVLSYFGDLEPLPGDAEMDPRFAKITIRHCLQHSGGFDRGKSFDPMFMPKPLMKLTKPPVEAETIIRFMLGRPLDFSPGERYAYSNFGYCLLGRIIEKVTGKPYEAAAREMVLRPIGACRTKMGKTRLCERAEHEVRYYPPKGTRLYRSVFPDVKEKVAEPYGAFYLAPMDSHGAWISSTHDLLRLVASLEGSRKLRILSEDSVRRMMQDTVSRGGGRYKHYGYGWSVGLGRYKGSGPIWKKACWAHNGALAGTATTLVRGYDGVAFAALFNGRSLHKDFYKSLDRVLWKAIGDVEKWPGHDLFEGQGE
jgi:N-acyl-D-amino-acid deacylase